MLGPEIGAGRNDADRVIQRGRPRIADAVVIDQCAEGKYAEENGRADLHGLVEIEKRAVKDAAEAPQLAGPADAEHGALGVLAESTVQIARRATYDEAITGPELLFSRQVAQMALGAGFRQPSQRHDLILGAGFRDREAIERRFRRHGESGDLSRTVG